MSTPRLLTIVAALCVPSAEAVTVSRVGRRGCGAGAGSPPCALDYHGSGNPSATPEPGEYALPTPNPAGLLFPGCNCPSTLGARAARYGSAPAGGPKVDPYAGLPDGEVEVLTVDTRLANKVRCDNVSVAEDVAKMLRIPMKRIKVTPWSWTLAVPQPTYLAFVQEDHDRCDCQGEGGKVLHGHGFKVASKGASDGQMLGSDRSVMTVSQYKAMTGQTQKADKSAHPSATATQIPGKETKGPPASRVQMLTRDPCLVNILRTRTEYFREYIAAFLGLPTDKVILNPPAVKGTVGLLQLDSTLNTEKAKRQVPVLAVQQCSPADAKALEGRIHLDLLAQRNTTNYQVSANASMPMNYVVATPNVTNGTNATNATKQRVSLVMKLSNVNYDLLAQSWALVSSFTSVVKGAISSLAQVPQDAVTLALFPGSVVVDAKIAAPEGTSPYGIFNSLNGGMTVCNKLSTVLNATAAFSQVTTGTIDCTVISLEIEDPPFPPDETNRAWIAFWSVVLLPPFAEDGAWRLLNLVNTPMSKLSKLLPQTLARVPGMTYRALEPNAANETRLPPPLDRAVGFGMPKPYAEDAALEAERKRALGEKMAYQLKLEAERAVAQEALTKSEGTALKVKQADTRVLNAATVHAMNIRSSTAVLPPDIVPYEVLTGATPNDPEPESPYPFRDQDPSYSATPPVALMQEPSTREQHPRQLRGREARLSRRSPSA